MFLQQYDFHFDKNISNFIFHIDLYKTFMEMVYHISKSLSTFDTFVQR